MPADTDLVPVAEKIRVLASTHAAGADRTERLAPAVVEAVREAGFLRHFVPARWGGAEASFGELTRAVTAVAEGCVATAWCASLAAYSARFAAYLPVAGQQALWAGGPDVFIATGLVPAGTAEQAGDGWRISGTWSYLSGIELADWVLLCGPAPAEGAPPARFFAVPRSRVSILRTWDSAGMRATGSHSAVLDDVLVPDHLTFARSDLFVGRNGTSQAVCHNVPFGAVGGLTFAPPVLGAATGALHAALALLAGKRRTAVLDQAIARASGQIEAAGLLIERAATVLDGGALTRHTTARNARDTAVATELLNDAVATLVRACGTGGLAQGHPLERYWRDATCAASHVALRTETSATTYVDILINAA